MAANQEIEVVEACTLVMLNTGQYQSQSPAQYIALCNGEVLGEHKKQVKDVMNKIIWSLLFYIGSVTSLLGQSSVRLRIDSVAIQNQLQRASQQIRHLSRATPADKFPQSFENGTHRFSNSSWWCSGFFPGTLLLLADATGDSELLQLGLDKLSYLEKEQFNTGTHDLGFMLYCSFGQALRLTGDSAQYLPVLEQAAASLASRFSPEVGAIRS